MCTKLEHSELSKTAGTRQAGKVRSTNLFLRELRQRLRVPSTLHCAVVYHQVYSAVRKDIARCLFACTYIHVCLQKKCMQTRAMQHISVVLV